MRVHLLVALPLAACLGTSTEEPPSDLEEPTGGYTMTDEPPMFGAPELAELEAETATSPAIEVNVVWGHVPADPDDHTARTWDGSLTVSHGALSVDDTIAFDRDDRLLPQPSPRTIAFESRTDGDRAGLALRIVERDPPGDPLTLTYVPARHSRHHRIQTVLDLGRLAHGPVVVDFGDGNRMVATAEHEGCLGGSMHGLWHQVPTAAGVVGRWFGIVTDRRGTHVGHVRGSFGQRRSGEQVVFGKLVDHAGHFTGLVRGTYDDDGGPRFAFRAKWSDRDRDERGRIRGAFVEGPVETSGTFTARWDEVGCAAKP